MTRLALITTSNVPSETVELMATACEQRDVECRVVDADTFGFEPDQRLEAGDLLYRPAIALSAARVEQFLWSTDVSSFYSDPGGPFFTGWASPLLFERHGIPSPRSVYVHDTNRDFLRDAVDQLGGLPVVVKAGPGSGGIGTLRADTLAGLFSLVDYLISKSVTPLLLAFVPDAVHWRLVVVGDRVVASYRNVTDNDDFRTSASATPADYDAEPPPAACRMAVDSVHVQRLEHGGVDVLEHPSGRLYFLEANFPCYYAQAQRAAGVDVAGAMVDHLVAKSIAILSASHAEG